MLYHSLINSQAQYGSIAWGRAACSFISYTANISCFKQHHEMFKHK